MKNVTLGQVLKDWIQVEFNISSMLNLKLSKMNYDDLKTGQKIQMFHHHNSIGNNYRWKDGIVDVRGGGKFFVPNNGLCTLLILPHRMDEIREPHDPPRPLTIPPHYAHDAAHAAPRSGKENYLCQGKESVGVHVFSKLR